MMQVRSGRVAFLDCQLSRAPWDISQSNLVPRTFVFLHLKYPRKLSDLLVLKTLRDGRSLQSLALPAVGVGLG
jgi:hypothetical protein